MNFRLAVKILNQKLCTENPKTFSSSWVLKFAPASYKYFRENVRTETDHIDWDRVTRALERRFQKRWIRYRVRKRKLYENQEELNLVLLKYKDKFYTFIAPQNPADRRVRDRITVALTRISQRGNILAQRELTKWLRYIADEWIDTYPMFTKWRIYQSGIDEKILHCIIHYKYTGTFLGYLFKTLEYSGRALPPDISFDDEILGGSRTRAEYIVPVYD